MNHGPVHIRWKDFIEPMAAISTAHLTLEDDNALSHMVVDGEGPLIGYLHSEYGIQIYIPEEIHPEQIDLMRERGLSDTLISLILEASEDGLVWILFDRDGAEHPDFPTFDWDTHEKAPA